MFYVLPIHPRIFKSHISSFRFVVLSFSAATLFYYSSMLQMVMNLPNFIFFPFNFTLSNSVSPFIIFVFQSLFFLLSFCSWYLERWWIKQTSGFLLSSSRFQVQCVLFQICRSWYLLPLSFFLCCILVLKLRLVLSCWAPIPEMSLTHLFTSTFLPLWRGWFGLGLTRWAGTAGLYRVREGTPGGGDEGRRRLGVAVVLCCGNVVMPLSSFEGLLRLSGSLLWAEDDTRGKWCVN